MLIELENGKTITGSEIYEATFRSSLEPIPCTFEARVRIYPDIAQYLLEGKKILAGRNKTPMTVVYVKDGVSEKEQAGAVVIRHVIALHANSCGISYRLERAVIREQVSLSEIYQACGGKSVVDKDFTVPRFYCYKGSLPGQQIALICQEHGGVVRWIPENDKMAFTRIYDLFKQEPKVIKADEIDATQRSGFLERHEVPSYTTTQLNGVIAKGDFSKPRAVRYSPHKNEQEIFNLSNVLLNAKTVPSEYRPDVHAGDLVKIGETLFVVITAAHSVQRDDAATEDFSMFWLGVKS